MMREELVACEERTNVFWTCIYTSHLSVTVMFSVHARFSPAAAFPSSFNPPNSLAVAAEGTVKANSCIWVSSKRVICMKAFEPHHLDHISGWHGTSFRCVDSVERTYVTIAMRSICFPALYDHLGQVQWLQACSRACAAAGIGVSILIKRVLPRYLQMLLPSHYSPAFHWLDAAQTAQGSAGRTQAQRRLQPGLQVCASEPKAVLDVQPSCNTSCQQAC